VGNWRFALGLCTKESRLVTSASPSKPAPRLSRGWSPASHRASQRNPGKSPSHLMTYGFRVGFLPLHGAPNQRMKLTWRGGRLIGKGSILIVAAAPRSLCPIR
jgi:hypothetical protein